MPIWPQNTREWNRENDDWKKVTNVKNVGPAPYYDPKDFGDNSYRRVTYEEAKAGKPCTVFADGCYDLFHAGHSRQFMQAKNYFPNVTLVVGIANNELTNKLKGPTVTEDRERYEAIRDCRYVDKVIPDIPWGYDESFFNKYKIDFLCHDDLPYGIGCKDDIYNLPRSLGMFCPTTRGEGISTSELIARVVKDHGQFTKRNLKRGFTRKDLNITFIREFLLCSENVNKLIASLAVFSLFAAFFISLIN